MTHIRFCQSIRSVREHRGAREIRRDEERLARKAVRPDAGEQCEEQEGQPARRHEHAHLLRVRTEDKGGGEGECDVGDRRADCGDGLARPEFAKLACQHRALHVTSDGCSAPSDVIHCASGSTTIPFNFTSQCT